MEHTPAAAAAAAVDSCKCSMITLSLNQFFLPPGCFVVVSGIWWPLVSATLHDFLLDLFILPGSVEFLCYF
jgi:hypothetical protein